MGAGGRDLTLVGVGPRDAGVYVCVAVNPAGEAQLNNAVVVIGEFGVLLIRVNCNGLVCNL